jgi:lysophospholipase L1-like esterase
MSLVRRIVLVVQAVLTGVAGVMSLWVGLPEAVAIGLGLVGISAMAATTPQLRRRKLVGRWGLAGAWAGTLIALGSMSLARNVGATLDSYFDAYYLGLAGIITGAILPADARWRGRAASPGWRLLVITWIMLADVAWVGSAYLDNRTGAFFIGLLVPLALLISCYFWFRLGTAGIVTVNTLVALIVGLPLLDLSVARSGWLRPEPDPRKQYYLYDAAKKDPVAFGRWWNSYEAEWRKVERRIYARDPDPRLGFRLRPNSHAVLMRSRININSHGFRGREISTDKGSAYRIVVLGESTSFGITFNEEDRPWPEQLEQLIRERLKPRRPVEVINAGVPGYRLDQSLRRFPTEILPLHPDMVITYHGINGFRMLRTAVPFKWGTAAPVYKQRPIRLLGDVEYRLKLLRFKDRRHPRLSPRAVPLTNPMDTLYTALYRELIQLTRTNHIRLALATFSMAANDRTDPDIVKFYELGYPAAAWQIQANLLHSVIVQQLATQHSKVCLVDTRPRLDGNHDLFIDLVHFAPAGDQEMAEVFFAALRPVLEEDLSGPR